MTTETIVLDLMMPEITGYQVCRLIKNDAYFSHVPIIILTALDGDRERQRGLLTGGDYFFTKPIQFKPFQELVAQCK
ncbi:MAG: hypothetical protein B6244_13735 [Candidatus Cloacimonetes bacterium 4572_55]|nr:MAG: hypothetical protein B6244_13735 [Candidatus Cloacimonetes bacterium 4572_55]